MIVHRCLREDCDDIVLVVMSGETDERELDNKQSAHDIMTHM